MEIILAKHAGFCFGVKRAMELVENETAIDEPIATYGPLIHNPQVVAQLQEKGVSIVNDIKDVEQGKVVIRSHGVGPGIYSQAESNGITILDATCPFVTKVQQAAQQALNVHEVILVAGDPNHPEVQGIAAWSDNKAIVVQSVEDAKLLDIQAKTGILLAQTTLQEKVFQEIAAALQDKVEDLKIVNTICAATRQRQDAALSLAQQVDIMIVVGGKDSSNTRKLAKLCVEAGTTTYHVEDANELNPYWFNKVRRAGITAGASTPDWIIEEVKRKMTEFSQEEDLTMEAVVDNTEDMSTSFEASLRTMKEGEVVSGVVVKVSQDEVLVDVGGKSEGIIPRREMASRVPENMNDIVKVGDELKVVILKAESDEGHILLSRKRVLEREVLEKIREAKENGEILTGEVVQVVKGGLRVDIGLLGFVPASQIDRGFVDNLDKYLGKTLRMRVIDIDPKRNNVVLSQKVLLEEEYAQAKEKTWAEIAENQTRKGVVRRLTDFGAFVDLGGVDGLLHISEMSWGRIKHPSEVVNVGDELEVFVLKVDRDNKKVSLGLKQVIPNPWSKISEKYPEGSIATAKIVRIANFGAFAELEPGVDGLIHISQLSNKRVNKPSDVVQIGQEVQVKVLEVKDEEKRISLSIRALEEEADIVENSVD